MRTYANIDWVWSVQTPDPMKLRAEEFLLWLNVQHAWGYQHQTQHSEQLPCAHFLILWHPPENSPLGNIVGCFLNNEKVYCGYNNHDLRPQLSPLGPCGELAPQLPCKVVSHKVSSHEQRSGLEVLVAKLNSAAAKALGIHSWTHYR